MLEPTSNQADENKIDSLMLDPQDVLRMKITSLMSKNSEVFLDLVLSENFDIASAGWEAMINHFRQSGDFRREEIAVEVKSSLN